MYENVNVDRLGRLERLLLADAGDPKGMKFDVLVIGRVGILPIDSADPSIVSCNTTGCAMGLAAMSGEFRDEGLGYEVDGTEVVITVAGIRRSYDHAACEFFGIPITWAWQLFSPGSYDDSERTGVRGEVAVAEKVRSRIQHVLETRSGVVS